MVRALSAARDAGGQVGSSANPPSNAAKTATTAPALSPGVFPANLHGMRRCFPARWAQFLNAHFHSATHVAAFFDVDHHTARAWMNGSHGANAPAVLYAVQRIPGAIKELIGEAA